MNEVVLADRRCGEDRRSADLGLPPGVPERRRPGRPRIPDEARPRTLHVKVTPQLHDAVSLISIRTGVPLNALIRRLLERQFLPAK